MKIIVRRPHTGPSIPELGAPTAITFSSITLPLVRPSTGPFGVASYRIERAPAIGGPWALAAEGPLVFGNPPAQYVDSGLVGNTDYFYRARATDTLGFTSEWCAAVTARTTAQTDSIPPTLPTGLNVLTLSSSSQRVSWNASTDTGGSGLAGYRLERSLNGTSGWTATHSGLLTATTLDVTGLAASTTYFYRVQAEDGAGNVSSFSVNASGTTQAAAGGPITVDLRVEYIDAVGNDVRVTANPDGSTVISGVAPFLVHFDATGSRGNLANNNTLAGAYYNLGFRLNYGENRGTFWPYGKAPYLSRDEDFGPPIFGHVYETPGTYLTRLKARDSNGAEVTVSVTVNVAAPPAATIIETSAGSWPVWTSGTHYQLRAGANYTSFGTLNLRRVHNVLISKIGAGVDPIVGEAYFGGESAADLDTLRARTRHVRFINVDVATVRTGAYGPLSCGVINGRLRRVTQDNVAALYQNFSTNATQRAQIMWPRNFFMYNSGLTNVAGENPVYLMISHRWRNWHMQGCRLQLPQGGVGSHIIRNTQHNSTARNCQIFCTDTTPYVSRIKMQADGTHPWDADTELVGPIAGPASAWYRYSNSFNVYQSIQFGGPGDVAPTATTFSSAPQNDVAGEPMELHEFVTIEDCQDTRPAASAVRGGRNMGARGLRNPDGSPWLLSETNFGFNRIPTDARGPYITEADNTRPIPSAF